MSTGLNFTAAEPPVSSGVEIAGRQHAGLDKSASFATEYSGEQDRRRVPAAALSPAIRQTGTGVPAASEGSSAGDLSGHEDAHGLLPRRLWRRPDAQHVQPAARREDGHRDPGLPSQRDDAGELAERVLDSYSKSSMEDLQTTIEASTLDRRRIERDRHRFDVRSRRRQRRHQSRHRQPGRGGRRRSVQRQHQHGGGEPAGIDAQQRRRPPRADRGYAAPDRDQHGCDLDSDIRNRDDDDAHARKHQSEPGAELRFPPAAAGVLHADVS